jgi:hypothetical protein
MGSPSLIVATALCVFMRAIQSCVVAAVRAARNTKRYAYAKV